MRIDPALHALRSDPAPQRNAQIAMEQAKADWRDSPKIGEILTELARFGSGDHLDDCPALHGALTMLHSAAGFIGGLVNSLTLQMARHPLGQVPFRHQYSGGMAIMQLASAGDAAISLVMYERRSRAQPETICFTDSERHEIVLAGTGEVQIVRRPSDTHKQANLASHSMLIGKGHSLSLGGMFETKFIAKVENCLVILRLSRTAKMAQPSLEFRLADGSLVHQTSGDKNDSRKEIMMALLGRMRRRDAAPVMAEMTLEGSDHLRWQALRECLALDTAQGFAALCEVAREPQDTLSANAGTLRAQLNETYPQLAFFEETLCPA